nr:TerC/Alx family metal homeostasis membrane protein [Arcanobacterium haemolyticum]
MLTSLFSVASSPATSDPSMIVESWEWLVLGIAVIALILFDLFGHVRKAHEPTIGEASRWTAVYISLAVLFGISTYFRHGGRFATEFFAGYITEYSLSLDNIFVFIIIIAAFKVPRKFQQKVLMWGIIIALVLRFIFIMIGAALVEQFVWVFFAFGIWMIYTAAKQILDGLKESRDRRNGVEEEDEYQPTAMTRFISRVFPVTAGFVGDKLFHRASGKTFLTPLMICIVSIGTIDLLFALDSIPAIFGLTKEPFIVFASNAFALLGLRQLFFLVDGLLDRLIYLHYGLAAILGFIGLKLLLHAFHGYGMLTAITEPTPGVSVGIILGIIIVTVVASIIGARKLRAEQ